MINIEETWQLSPQIASH